MSFVCHSNHLGSRIHVMILDPKYNGFWSRYRLKPEARISSRQQLLRAQNLYLEIQVCCVSLSKRSECVKPVPQTVQGRRNRGDLSHVNWHKYCVISLTERERRTSRCLSQTQFSLQFTSAKPPYLEFKSVGFYVVVFVVYNCLFKCLLWPHPHF